MTKPVCAVVGVGEGNGAALARAFSREGMALALLARGTEYTGALASELGDCRAYSCDVSDPASVADAFAGDRSISAIQRRDLQCGLGHLGRCRKHHA
jgi:NAD(P)-dependent dehydrogenase (short-subunit alcohol dehydrogenase family)